SCAIGSVCKRVRAQSDRCAIGSMRNRVGAQSGPCAIGSVRNRVGVQTGPCPIATPCVRSLMYPIGSVFDREILSCPIVNMHNQDIPVFHWFLHLTIIFSDFILTMSM
ncbi:hypothetical protein ALC57_18632, partial [Trachymyrmex cornetzi]